MKVNPRQARIRAKEIIARYPRTVTLLWRVNEHGPHGRPYGYFVSGPVVGWPQILAQLEENMKERT